MAPSRQTPQSNEKKGTFELSGGALCLDFANTSRYIPPPREDLASYDALMTWSEEAGVLGRTEARALRAAAESSPREAEAVLNRARDLRLAIYRTFSAAAAGEKASREDLAVIDRAAVEAGRHFRIVPRERRYVWEIAPEAARALDRPVWSVARSAVELLTSGEISAVRECALETCAWLFLDRSKNQKRRWCDMKVCGNRSKARRHYEKTRRV